MPEQSCRDRHRSKFDFRSTIAFLNSASTSSPSDPAAAAASSTGGGRMTGSPSAAAAASSSRTIDARGVFHQLRADAFGGLAPLIDQLVVRAIAIELVVERGGVEPARRGSGGAAPCAPPSPTVAVELLLQLAARRRATARCVARRRRRLASSAASACANDARSSALSARRTGIDSRLYRSTQPLVLQVAAVDLQLAGVAPRATRAPAGRGRRCGGTSEGIRPRLIGRSGLQLTTSAAIEPLPDTLRLWPEGPGPMDEHAQRNRQHGRDRGRRRPLLGRADRAVAASFQHRRRALPAADDSRARHPQEGRGARRTASSARCRPTRSTLIVRAADEVIDGKLDDHFPLFVWQTGSGTQTNMNANEVISNRAIELAGGDDRQQEADPSERSRQSRPVVERHVSDGDAHRRGRGGRAPPAAGGRRRCARRSTRKARAFADIVKIGRTHLQDATPLTLGQEISGWVAQLDLADARDRGDAARRLRAGARRHGRRHRPQHASRVRRARRATDRGADRAAVRDARRTSSRRSPATRRSSRCTAR